MSDWQMLALFSIAAVMLIIATVILHEGAMGIIYRDSRDKDIPHETLWLGITAFFTAAAGVSALMISVFCITAFLILVF